MIVVVVDTPMARDTRIGAKQGTTGLSSLWWLCPVDDPLHRQTAQRTAVNVFWKRWRRGCVERWRFGGAGSSRASADEVSRDARGV